MLALRGQQKTQRDHDRAGDDRTSQLGEQTDFDLTGRHQTTGQAVNACGRAQADYSRIGPHVCTHEGRYLQHTQIPSSLLLFYLLFYHRYSPLIYIIIIHIVAHMCVPMKVATLDCHYHHHHCSYFTSYFIIVILH